METKETNQQMRERIVGGLRAGVSGNPEAFLAVLSPDIVIYEPEYLSFAGVHRGRDAVMGIMGEASKYIDFSTLEILSVLQDDNRLAMLMSVETLKEGPRRHAIEHWTVGEDGLVEEVRVFWDAAL